MRPLTTPRLHMNTHTHSSQLFNSLLLRATFYFRFLYRRLSKFFPASSDSSVQWICDNHTSVACTEGFQHPIEPSSVAVGLQGRTSVEPSWPILQRLALTVFGLVKPLSATSTSSWRTTHEQLDFRHCTPRTVRHEPELQHYTPWQLFQTIQGSDTLPFGSPFTELLPRSLTYAFRLEPGWTGRGWPTFLLHTTMKYPFFHWTCFSNGCREKRWRTNPVSNFQLSKPNTACRFFWTAWRLA